MPQRVGCHLVAASYLWTVYCESVILCCVDFCSCAVRMASQNEASIWVSSGTHSHKKHAAEPMQFGKTLPPFSSVGNCLRLRYCRKSLGRTIRKVQSLSL